MANHTTEAYIYGAYDTKSYENHWRARIGYTYTQNTTNKTSTVTLKLYVYNGYTSYNQSANEAYYKFMDTTTHYKTYNFSTAKKWNLIATTTKTVNHNSSGKASLAVNGTWCSGMSSATYTPYTLTVNGTIYLDDIPVASTVSGTNCIIGQSSTITLRAFSTVYKHKLSYKVGSGSYTTIAENVGSNYTWVTPTSLKNYLTSSTKSVTVTIKAETFNGSTSLGDSTTTITVTADEGSYKPDVSMLVYDVSPTTLPLTHNEDVLVKYGSYVECKVTASGKNGASITRTEVHNGSRVVVNPTNGYCWFQDCENPTFTVTVTDSRGYTNTATVTKTMINYVKPTVTLNVTSVDGGSGKVNVNISGDVFKGYFGGALTAEQNNYRLVVVYKDMSSGTEYTTSPLSITVTDNKYNFSGSITLDYQKEYEIKAKITDSIDTIGVVSDARKVVFKPVFYWGRDNFYFNVPVTFKSENVSIEDMFYQPDEEVTLYYDGGGYVTTSSKQINFSVPLNKLFGKVDGIELQSGSSALTLCARQNGNYICGSGSGGEEINKSGYTITLTLKSNCLSVRIVKSSAFTSATNNDGVGINATIKVKFTSSGNFQTDSYNGEELTLED